MILIKTYISQSKIPNAGLGVFSAERVHRGQEVTPSVPGTYDIFTDEEYEKSHPSFQNFISEFGCYKNGVWTLEKDNEKFINHSRNPNLDPGGFALRDIAPGDELTYDYREVDESIQDDPPDWL